MNKSQVRYVLSLIIVIGVMVTFFTGQFYAFACLLMGYILGWNVRDLR